MTLPTPRARLAEVAERAIPADLDTWPAIERRLRLRRRRTTQLRAMAALALALVVLTAGIQTLGNPQTVSADTVLSRAGAATEGAVPSARSFHILATSTFTAAPGVPGGTQVQHEETWFGGGDRLRQEVQSPLWSTVTVRNGSQTWWAVTRGRQTYFTEANGVRFTDVARLNPLAPETSTIGSVLDLLGRQGCGSAQIRPDATVAGRQVYVVAVPHTFSSACVDPLQAVSVPSPSATLSPAAKATEVSLITAKQATAQALAPRAASPVPAGAGGQAKGDPSAERDAMATRLASTTVVDTFWIDKQTFVPLRAEQTNGIKGSTVYEVASVTYDVTLPDTTFQYAPPAGAQHLSDPATLKETLARTRP